MFSFYVFVKLQRFISVRADSIYICVEIQIGEQVDTKDLAEDTLSRAFQELLTDFADLNQ